jgi:hypothetical protein
VLLQSPPAADRFEPPPQTVAAPRPEGGATEEWHDLTAMATSTVIHVVALVVLALIVPRLRDDGQPVQIISASPEQEADFEDFDPLPVAIPAAEPVAAEPPVPDVPPDAAELVVAIDGEAGMDVADPDAFAGLLADAAFGSDALLGEFAVRRAGGGTGGSGNGIGGEIGRRLAKAGAGSGAIQVSLAWNNFNDLDLHVIPPSGERIFFAQRRSRCGGHLDVDMNAQGAASREPVENVYWPRQRAPRGGFAVYVHHFARHDPIDETPFELHVLVDGERQSFKGVVRSGMPPIRIAEFRRRPAAGGAEAEQAAENEFPE